MEVGLEPMAFRSQANHANHLATTAMALHESEFKQCPDWDPCQQHPDVLKQYPGPVFLNLGDQRQQRVCLAWPDRS